MTLAQALGPMIYPLPCLRQNLSTRRAEGQLRTKDPVELVIAHQKSGEFCPRLRSLNLIKAHFLTSGPVKTKATAPTDASGKGVLMIVYFLAKGFWNDIFKPSIAFHGHFNVLTAITLRAGEKI